jgi:hypothetical protein
MRPVVSLREETLAAIDEYERQAQALSNEDRQFLSRLHNSDVWSQIGTHCKTTADYRRLIEVAVLALRAATAQLELREISAQRTHDLAQAKAGIDDVRNYFAKWRNPTDNLNRALELVQSELAPRDIGDGLKVSIVGALTKPEHCVAQVAIALNSETLPWPGREYQTSAGQRGMFMLCLGLAMREIFGKPWDSAVAALTDIAFKRRNETTIGQVRKAWDRYQRRRNWTTHR